MYHVLTDEEFQEYKNVLSEFDKIKRWKSEIEKNAVYYIEDRVIFHKISIKSDRHSGQMYQLECFQKDPKNHGYCDMCPLAWIFHGECPTGREKHFSK
jgi:hypothetical protein